ncbi:MAG: hypothetical protein OXU20_00710, partial [Myxococcales bacterium]|nr:hypothetical protein [Myxococcales bacterium]
PQPNKTQTSQMPLTRLIEGSGTGWKLGRCQIDTYGLPLGRMRTTHARGRGQVRAGAIEL